MSGEINKYLSELGFSGNEIKVYVSLTRLGEAKASEIAKKSDLPRTTVISILEKLEKSNYITTHKYRGTTYYWIESPSTIRDGLMNKIRIAEDLNRFLASMYRTEADFPQAKVIDTKSGIKSFIEKTLSELSKKSIIYTIDNPHTGNYDKVLSREYGAILVGIKNKKNIVTHTLVPAGTFRKITPQKLKTQNIIVKEMPPEIDFPSSVWVISNTLVIFSGHPPFITSIKHKNIVDSFRSLYLFLWCISKETS